MSITEIESLDLNAIIEDDVGETIEEITIDDSFKLFDSSIPNEFKLRMIQKYYPTHPEKIEELIERLISIYNITQLSLHKRLIIQISELEILPVMIRISCAYCLTTSVLLAGKNEHLEFTDEGKECLFKIRDYYHLLPCALHIELLFCLYDADYKRDELLPYVEKFVLNDSIDEKIRFHVLYTHFEHDDNLKTRLLCNFTNCGISIQMKGQVYKTLVFCNDSEIIDRIANDILKIIENRELSDRDRANMADIILNAKVFEKEIKERAQQIIRELGGNTLNIYENKENAHTESFKESVLKFIEYLKNLKESQVPYDYVKYQLKQHAKKQYRKTTTSVKTISFKKDKFQVQDSYVVENEEDYSEEEKAIAKALYNIEHDSTKFDYIEEKYPGFTLMELMIRLYMLVLNANVEILKRLLEELIEMADVCSSGYLVNLVNVFSGFELNGEIFNLNMSWQDQIAAYLGHRINCAIQNEENCDEILAEMTNKSILEKPCYRKMLREQFSRIRQELFEEFHEYITDEEFDTYFRFAFASYEGY